MPTHPRAASALENAGSRLAPMPRPGSNPPLGSSCSRNARTSAWSASSSAVSSVGSNRMSPPYRLASLTGKPVGPGGGVVEEVELLRRAEGRGHPLEGVPDLDVAEAGLVDREVRFEHAARRAERADGEVDLVAPGAGDLLRRRLHLALVPPLPREWPYQRADLQHHVLATSQLGQISAPHRPHLVGPAAVG